MRLDEAVKSKKIRGQVSVFKKKPSDPTAGADFLYIQILFALGFEPNPMYAIKTGSDIFGIRDKIEWVTEDYLLEKCGDWEESKDE